MFSNNCLRLSGEGRLCNITYGVNQAAYFTFHLRSQFNDSPSNDIWIKCRASLANFPESDNLVRFLNEKKEVTVQFDAQYLGLKQSYPGLSENDPDLIVCLDGELIKIRDYRVQGDNLLNKPASKLKNIIHRNFVINN
jgi:hypothetical protein